MAQNILACIQNYKHDSNLWTRKFEFENAYPVKEHKNVWHKIDIVILGLVFLQKDMKYLYIYCSEVNHEKSNTHFSVNIAIHKIVHILILVFNKIKHDSTTA